MKNIFYLALLVIGFTACRTNPKIKTIKHPTTNFRLLDKATGAEFVAKDSKEGYFDRVIPLEISIQMKQHLEDQPRAAIIDQYKQYLKDDVEEFSPEESKFAETYFKQALDYCGKIDAKLKLPEIQLIKTAGKYYGPGTYYTRDNCIIIPAGQLEEGNENSFVETMIHEIFHIYSRYNNKKRDELYASIGFKPIKNIKLGKFLEQRVLYNPDGVDIQYAIDVQDTSGRAFKAIPIIYSQFKNYREDFPGFMNYIVFQLFEIQKQGGQWTVINPTTGYSEDDLQNFWEQVGTNTRYTWHPDEILADNFKLLAVKKANSIRQLKPEGSAQLETIEQILKK
ncbi:MAG: hypothetical protein GY810_00825 [Aureispira sp.]|nr:hypothetical protein [Aureispira sp.]